MFQQRWLTKLWENKEKKKAKNKLKSNLDTAHNTCFKKQQKWLRFFLGADGDLVRMAPCTRLHTKTFPIPLAKSTPQLPLPKGLLGSYPPPHIAAFHSGSSSDSLDSDMCTKTRSSRTFCQKSTGWVRRWSLDNSKCFDLEPNEVSI